MIGTGWHLSPALADRYWRRDVDSATAASIDAHLLQCASCQRIAVGAADADMVDDVWRSIVDTLDRPQLGVVERGLVWIGCSESTARIVAATTRARWAYLFVVVVSIAMAVVSAVSVTRSDDWFVGFLIVAPLGPLIAAAAAFGRFADPAHAVLRCLPTSSLRIVLVRTVAGVVPAIALTALATPLLIDRGWMAAAWLLPSLALTLMVLLLSTWFDVELAAACVAVGWIALPIVLRVPVGRLIDAFSGPVQSVSLGIVAIAAVVGYARRSSFDWGGR